jgi:hypothetical protein
MRALQAAHRQDHARRYVSSSFVMEEIKSTTVLPLDYAPAKRN